MSMLKRLRLDLGLTQEEMAKKMEINICTYRNYESGKRKMNLKTLIIFLKLRSYPQDLELVNILEEIE